VYPITYDRVVAETADGQTIVAVGAVISAPNIVALGENRLSITPGTGVIDPIFPENTNVCEHIVALTGMAGGGIILLPII